MKEKVDVKCPIPDSVQSFMQFYDSYLTDVQFPDVDQNLLQKEINTVELHSQNLADAETQLAIAKEALHSAEESLWQLTKRAYAYVKIYAEGRDELYENLAKISLRRISKNEYRNDPPNAPKKMPAKRKKAKGPLTEQPMLINNDQAQVDQKTPSYIKAI